MINLVDAVLLYNIHTMQAMQVTSIPSLEKIIQNSLEEDLGSIGDITSIACIPSNHTSLFELIVNDNAVLSGISIFEQTFKYLDKTIKVSFNFKDSDEIKPKDTVCTVSGNTQNILKGERVALNFISHLSGIATTTKELTKLINHTKTTLLDTRKTTPGLRVLEKAAVIAGGGKNHRFDLSEMVLIKDNHIKTAGGIKNAFQAVKNTYKNKFKIEIEVKDFKELNEAIECNPDIIMFDNWNLEDIRKYLKTIPKNQKTEVSGLITKENIKLFAEIGVDYISTSYMIKNSRWTDFSLNAV